MHPKNIWIEIRVRIFEANTRMNHRAVHFSIPSQRIRLNCCSWPEVANAEATAVNVEYRENRPRRAQWTPLQVISSQEFQEQKHAIELPVFDKRAMSKHFQRHAISFLIFFSLVRQRMLFNCSAVDIHSLQNDQHHYVSSQLHGPYSRDRDGKKLIWRRAHIEPG